MVAKKKVLSFFVPLMIVVAMILIISSQTAHANDRYEDNGLIFELNSDGTAAVIGNEYFSPVTEIPATVSDGEKTYTVTQIGDEAFDDALGLKSVTVPASVKCIGASAFYYSSVETVEFEAGSQLESIGSKAFGNCGALKNITFPASLKSLGEQVFECNDLESSLKTVVFEQGSQLESIGEKAFFTCKNLKTVTVPANVESIAEHAFDKCSKELVLVGNAGSYLEKYATEHAILFEESGKISIAKAKVTGVKDKIYTGNAIKQTPVVSVDGKTLKRGTDYSLHYEKNVAIGKAKMTIRGKGEYTGQAVRYFNIKSNIKVRFPDIEFRGYVKRKLDKNKDGGLSKAEIRNVRTIKITKHTWVKNLKGIEMFYNLTTLKDYAASHLTKVDLSKNTKLKRLEVKTIGVRKLDLSKNKKLEDLNCEQGSLKTLILPNNGKLKKLNCSSNSLIRLDIRGCRGLIRVDASVNKISTIKIGTKKKLTYLCLGENRIKKIDLSGCSRLENLNINTNRLTKLNLKKNERLMVLDCADNNLKKLNVMKNRKLKRLCCSYNKLKTMNVGKNKKLTSLLCDVNYIKTLNIARNRKLTELSCESNKLTRLNVSRCPKIKYIYAEMNRIRSLDVRKCRKLREVTLDRGVNFIKNGKWKKGPTRGSGSRWYR